MIIAVDFDGTCVTHEYPKVGKDIGAVPVLKWLVSEGHKLILWTMRGSLDRGSGTGDLQDAMEWFDQHNIRLYGVNNNPTQRAWTKSPKAYAEIYIDDAALGCPLLSDPALSTRPFVDWVKVEHQLRDIFAGKMLVGHTTLQVAK